jgi:hypothetical protein
VNVTSLEVQVWIASAVVLAALLGLVLILSKWLAARRLLLGLSLLGALGLSGPAVTALVKMWTSAPDRLVVPGIVITWTPAAVALAAILLFGRRQSRRATR